MGARALMFQGTGSDVGKSVLTAALCRLARRRGLKVAPFKPQNMSNNAAATNDGGEIGRAQALQARACGLEPRVDFNPVLLKPQSDRTAQLVVQGRARGASEASDYFRTRDSLRDAVMQSFSRLSGEFELVLVEGAGSPSEINLRDRDIANMGFARMAGVPVVLIGDIDRGGVIASIVGTQAILDPQDAAMIRGFLINKFRGDPSLFADGMVEIERRTGWHAFGLVPWLAAAARLPAEDAVIMDRAIERRQASLKIVAPMLSRMANFDDADPLRAEPGVDFVFIPPGQALPRDADAIILFGTKSTLAELDFLRVQGWDIDIAAHARTGGRILGICGGMQMLGRSITDPDGSDGVAGMRHGLGLLDIETTMLGEKRVRTVEGMSALWGDRVSGYEIHAGRTLGPDCARPLLRLSDGPEGAHSADGLVEGTYVHGLFAADAYRRAWLERLRTGASSWLNYGAGVDRAIDDLADGLEQAVDLDALLREARPVGWTP